MARSQVPFIGRSGRARRCPGRGLGMAMTWSSATSSGWAGRVSVGGVGGCRGDVCGVLAWPEDCRNSRGRWCLGDMVGDKYRLFSPCLTPVMEGGQRGMVREWLVTAESK
jgi:hypothetical protein